MSAKSHDDDHRFYRIRGRSNENSKRKNNGHAKTKPGVRWSAPWLCPDRDCHNHAPDAVLVNNPRNK